MDANISKRLSSGPESNCKKLSFLNVVVKGAGIMLKFLSNGS